MHALLQTYPELPLLGVAGIAAMLSRRVRRVALVIMLALLLALAAGAATRAVLDDVVTVPCEGWCLPAQWWRTRPRQSWSGSVPATR